MIENLVESFESLFDLLAPDQDSIEEEVGQYVAAIAADREGLGTLASEPLDELDVILAGLLTLLARLERGAPLTTRQRKALATMLRLGLGNTMDGLTKERARREAARRGGRAGRMADAAKVMETWQAKLEESRKAGRAKRGWADEETAKAHCISPSNVRKIRAAQIARK